MSEKEKREFKGIWIPAEIWLKKELSVLERGLFAEIDSFDRTESGCYAGNDYFAEFFGVSAPSIARAIRKLLQKELIVRAGYRNRKRILKVNKQFFLDFYQNDNRDVECQNDRSTSIKMIGEEYQNDTHINTEINTLNNKDSAPSKKVKKIKYADSVSMTEVQHCKLLERFGVGNTQRAIEKLSAWKQSKGKKYKSDYGAILSWVMDSIGAKEQEIVGWKCPKCEYLNEHTGGQCLRCKYLLEDK